MDTSMVPVAPSPALFTARMPTTIPEEEYSSTGLVRLACVSPLLGVLQTRG